MLKWYYFYTPDYEIWHHHLSSRLGNYFSMHPILAQSLNIHYEHPKHHFTGCTDKVKLVIYCIKENMGQKIVFSDATLFIKNPEEMHALVEKCDKNTFALNQENTTNINIGLCVIFCNPESLQMWENVLEELEQNKDLHDQTLVMKYSKGHDFFDYNKVYCKYIDTYNVHLVPKDFACLKAFTHSCRSKEIREAHRFKTLELLGLKFDDIPLTTEQRIEERLAIGRERYGHGVRSMDDTRQWGTKVDSWLLMADEELLDALIYVAADYIRKYNLSSEPDDNALIQRCITEPYIIKSTYHQNLIIKLKNISNMGSISCPYGTSA